MKTHRTYNWWKNFIIYLLVCLVCGWIVYLHSYDIFNYQYYIVLFFPNLLILYACIKYVNKQVYDFKIMVGLMALFYLPSSFFVSFAEVIFILLLKS